MDSDASNSSSSLDEEEEWLAVLERIKENADDGTVLEGKGSYTSIENMTNDGWEELGRDISINTHLVSLCLCDGAIDDQTISFFFRGLTISSSIVELYLNENELSVAGVRSMLPFLHNANHLQVLDLCNNSIQSEGFNLMLRALRNRPIKKLSCCRCGIESIDIDSDHIPKYLTDLDLKDNKINADGCRGLANALHQGDTTLSTLWLQNNRIDDEGVEILVDVLQNNTSLVNLDLRENNDISNQGKISLLKLVNDISSIPATLQSNHTLAYIAVGKEFCVYDPNDVKEQIQQHIGMATHINKLSENNPEAAGRDKMIRTQLNSTKRAELADFQGVNRSLYSEINPLHLPEVLSLVGQHHGQGELYVALRSSIAGVISTVIRKQCLHQQREYHRAMIAEHRAKAEAVEAEIAATEAAESHVDDIGSTTCPTCSHKRRRGAS